MSLPEVLLILMPLKQCVYTKFLVWLPCPEGLRKEVFRYMLWHLSTPTGETAQGSSGVLPLLGRLNYRSRCLLLTNWKLAKHFALSNKFLEKLYRSWFSVCVADSFLIVFAVLTNIS